MRIFLVYLFSALCFYSQAQEIDSISIPKGMSYKYCDPVILADAKLMIEKELLDSATYELNDGILFIGPVLWSRYKKIPDLQKISGGNVFILFNKEKLTAKIAQGDAGFRKLWDQLRTEVSDSSLVLRKPTHKELQYYWSVVSFDIEEPLFIAEANERRFILNLSPKTLKLLWLDEVPANF